MFKENNHNNISGWICQMLRNHKHFVQPSICRKDRFKEASHETKSKGEDDPRNSNSSRAEQ